MGGLVLGDTLGLRELGLCEGFLVGDTDGLFVVGVTVVGIRVVGLEEGARVVGIRVVGLVDVVLTVGALVVGRVGVVVVGSRVGDVVVGSTVGLPLGEEVGESVTTGDSVDGLKLGSIEGIKVSPNLDGDLDGANEGLNVGDCVVGFVGFLVVGFVGRTVGIRVLGRGLARRVGDLLGDFDVGSKELGILVGRSVGTVGVALGDDVRTAGL